MAETTSLPADADHDILRPDRVADPFPYFAHMRDNDPVHWNPQYRAWFAYRHADVIKALRDPALSSDRVRPIYESKLSAQEQAERKPTFDILGDWMVFLDPPEHTRLRKLVLPAFSAGSVERMRPRVESVVKSTVDALADRSRFDLVTDFAYPIPAVVIAELMGVPPADRDLFKAWSDQILVLVFGAAGNAERRSEAQRGLVELADYLRGLVARFRADPGDNLISRMLNSTETDPPLTDDELVATCVLLVFGGHETTTNLIANGFRSLCRNPGQLARLRAEPDLMRKAVEELLRYDGPSKMEVRRVAADTELGGRTLRPGEQVYLVQASANRDADAFERADELILDRTPNRHVSFGFGIHHCIGNFLARLEASVALGTLIRNVPELELDPDVPESWHATLISRGMHHLGVRR
ncbi:cytochrome P450 [Amycolatopsis sp. K13G38]|uniref:Cytochrome P450 n=1 Tax=Amycolatopsis acididurans TaxID=2724524 RepID=A0ABX1JBQ7_9PSEU|nr:cytochrome P450 [Amycolatopsis acididurans]NKQ57225.1 cytochrome P450 [Amycolatopsis acididurans]